MELDLSGKDKAQAGNVVPTFYSLAGEAIAIPEKFLAAGSRHDKRCQLHWLYPHALFAQAASRW